MFPQCPVIELFPWIRAAESFSLLNMQAVVSCGRMLHLQTSLIKTNTLHRQFSVHHQAQEINNFSQLLSDNGLKWFKGIFVGSLSTNGRSVQTNQSQGLCDISHLWPMTCWQFQDPLRVGGAWPELWSTISREREIIFRAGREESHRKIPLKHF